MPEDHLVRLRAHVEAIRSGIPAEEWCAGHPKEPGTGLFARLFRRG
ncbi:MAG TPA: hypothetical protein VMZ00_04030 [Sporichthya sp.]|nr:hypothetical protein [Sporichthya sp.]